jgi:hypothetical protein
MLSDSTTRISSPTGTCFHAPTTDLWGPDETRVSRPVLREREGEIPSRHSPERHARFDRGPLARRPSTPRWKACTRRETRGTEPTRPTGGRVTSGLPHWDEIGNEVPFLIGHVAVRCPPCTIGLFRSVRNEYQHSCCVRPAGGKWVLQERKLSEQPLTGVPLGQGRHDRPRHRAR